MAGFLDRLFGRKAKKLLPESLSYEDEKKFARDENPLVRQELALRPDVRPEILYFLAEDPAPEVRQALAENENLPHQADILLARDPDESVRTRLAQKVSKLTPSIDRDEQEKLAKTVHDTLDLLARDQVTAVRQILAEALKDVAGAPPDVIKRLARDIELTVAGPVLEFSPVLSDDDLMEIIQSSPVRGALSAIARRTGVKPRVADAIAATDDVEAIAQLLGNSSAQIREETLDKLVDRAVDVVSWHQPLVNRPQLPRKAARKIAGFVAANLLLTLSAREDLDEAVLAEVAKVVERRIEEGDLPDWPEDQKKPRTPRGPVDSLADKAFAKARRMNLQGTLNDAALLDAIGKNDMEFVKAALSVRADLAPELIDKAVENRSAKGLTAISAKANFQAQTSVQIQVKLGRIPPQDVVQPWSGNKYAFTDQEVDWQIDFLKSLLADEKEGADKPKAAKNGKNADGKK